MSHWQPCVMSLLHLTHPPPQQLSSCTQPRLWRRRAAPSTVVHCSRRSPAQLGAPGAPTAQQSWPCPLPRLQAPAPCCSVRLPEQLERPEASRRLSAGVLCTARTPSACPQPSTGVGRPLQTCPTCPGCSLPAATSAALSRPAPGLPGTAMALFARGPLCPLCLLTPQSTQTLARLGQLRSPRPSAAVARAAQLQCLPGTGLSAPRALSAQWRRRNWCQSPLAAYLPPLEGVDPARTIWRRRSTCSPSPATRPAEAHQELSLRPTRSPSLRLSEPQLRSSKPDRLPRQGSMPLPCESIPTHPRPSRQLVHRQLASRLAQTACPALMPGALQLPQAPPAFLWSASWPLRTRQSAWTPSTAS